MVAVDIFELIIVILSFQAIKDFVVYSNLKDILIRQIDLYYSLEFIQTKYKSVDTMSQRGSWSHPNFKCN